MTSRTETYAKKILTGENIGKTRTQLALESGFAPKYAKNPGAIESSRKFQQMLVTSCPDNLIKQKLLESLNCVKPMYTSKGELIAETPDNANRLRALEILLKLRNLFPKDIAETNANNLSAWLNGIKSQKIADQFKQDIKQGNPKTFTISDPIDISTV
jgi:hypothetical protein